MSTYAANPSSVSHRSPRSTRSRPTVVLSLARPSSANSRIAARKDSRTATVGSVRPAKACTDRRPVHLRRSNGPVPRRRSSGFAPSRRAALVVMRRSGIVGVERAHVDLEILRQGGGHGGQRPGMHPARRRGTGRSSAAANGWVRWRPVRGRVRAQGRAGRATADRPRGGAVVPGLARPPSRSRASRRGSVPPAGGDGPTGPSLEEAIVHTRHIAPHSTDTRSLTPATWTPEIWTPAAPPPRASPRSPPNP